MLELPAILRCAFLFVDFQRDFCSSGGYRDMGDAGTDWVRGIIPNATRLLAFAREKRAFIVHTREGYASDLHDVSPSKLRKGGGRYASIGDKGPMGRFLIRGEYGHEFIDQMRPVDGETVLDKTTYSAFCGTSLDTLLKGRGITTLILAGVTADVCVHSTMREAVDLGYDCVYVKDAISTPDPTIRMACEAMVLEEGHIWGQLADVDDVVNFWR
jgi:nicotinamidase-related amidase